MLLVSTLVALVLIVGLFIFFATDLVMGSNSKASDMIMGKSKARDTLIDNLKDPLITSRAYFTEPAKGPIGDFIGYSPMPQDNWLHSFTHEETKDEGGEYYNISGFI